MIWSLQPANEQRDTLQKVETQTKTQGAGTNRLCSAWLATGGTDQVEHLLSTIQHDLVTHELFEITLKDKISD